MKTEILLLEEDKIDRDIMKKASNLIKAGELVAFPTETVYGLGADGLNTEAVSKIFKAKGRPSDNPLILHIADPEQLEDLVEEVPEAGRKCIEKFWPGALTLIFKKSRIVPDIISAGLDTVAIRMPDNKIALELIKESNRPIAAPSANTSGKPSPTKAEHVKLDMDGKIPMIIDGGSTGIGLESTVLDLTESIPMVLRPGGVTVEELRELLGNVETDSSITEVDSDLIPKSPGQKYKHYAPKAEMFIYDGEIEKIIHSIREETKIHFENGKKVGIMCTDQTKEFYKQGISISMGNRDDKSSIGHNLFNTIRRLDELDVDIILAESVSMEDMGIAIMNRMLKAADGKIIRVKEE